MDINKKFRTTATKRNSYEIMCLPFSSESIGNQFSFKFSYIRFWYAQNVLSLCISVMKVFWWWYDSNKQYDFPIAVKPNTKTWKNGWLVLVLSISSEEFSIPTLVEVRYTEILCLSNVTQLCNISTTVLTCQRRPTFQKYFYRIYYSFR